MGDVIEIRDAFGEVLIRYAAPAGSKSLRAAVLEGAELTAAQLPGADLGRDNLGGATSLAGADLRGARLDGAQLQGAGYDERTRFPAGFSPAAAGMVRAIED